MAGREETGVSRFLLAGIARILSSSRTVLQVANPDNDNTVIGVKQLLALGIVDRQDLANGNVTNFVSGSLGFFGANVKTRTPKVGFGEESSGRLTCPSPCDCQFFENHNG
jgi:hypothetical protein